MDKQVRVLRSHVAEGVDPERQLVIEVVDGPGPGGANHRYDITGFDTDTNPASVNEGGYKARFSRLVVIFQNGPIAEAGVNGITNEALLAIVLDRLERFQEGPFACPENSMAAMRIVAALHFLQKRTRDRIARGVEGTNNA